MNVTAVLVAVSIMWFVVVTVRLSLRLALVLKARKANWVEIPLATELPLCGMRMMKRTDFMVNLLELPSDDEEDCQAEVDQVLEVTVGGLFDAPHSMTFGIDGAITFGEGTDPAVIARALRHGFREQHKQQIERDAYIRRECAGTR